MPTTFFTSQMMHQSFRHSQGSARVDCIKGPGSQGAENVKRNKVSYTSIYSIIHGEPGEDPQSTLNLKLVPPQPFGSTEKAPFNSVRISIQWSARTLSSGTEVRALQASPTRAQDAELRGKSGSLGKERREGRQRGVGHRSPTTALKGTIGEQLMRVMVVRNVVRRGHK